MRIPTFSGYFASIDWTGKDFRHCKFVVPNIHDNLFIEAHPDWGQKIKQQYYIIKKRFNMKNSLLTLLFSLIFSIGTKAQTTREIRRNIPLDSIVLSDPFILTDQKTNLYYMTGTGGMLWKSKDLKFWDGPYKVAQTDPNSWMGPKPMIWAAEIHPFKGKYYYFATFTNRAVKIDTYRGNEIERRASHILVSDNPGGPYVPMKDSIYLPVNKPTLDGTFWVDRDGKPYMVYCYEWLQNWNGTIEKIELKPDLSGSIGEGKVLFRASDSPWSREKDEKGADRPNRVTDGPYLFKTATGPFRNDLDQLDLRFLHAGRCLFHEWNARWPVDSGEKFGYPT